MGATLRLTVALCTTRVLLASLLQTSFVPDEYWQGPEVAHALAFSDGLAGQDRADSALTWEWRAALRGGTHPLLYALLYRALAAVGWDWSGAVAAAPVYAHGRKRERGR